MANQEREPNPNKEALKKIGKALGIAAILPYLTIKTAN